MQFIYADGWQNHIQPLTESIARPLREGKRVLWLLGGGSSMPADVAVMQALASQATAQLHIMLTDERYGPEGHPDSNWQQLTDLGFAWSSATATPVLNGNTDLETTVARFDQALAKAFEQCDVVIAQYGIGPDGHIAGILPGSLAASETTSLAAGYQADPYTRITMTFPAFQYVDEAYVFAFGDGKKPALQRLQSNETIALHEQPAQILKQLPVSFIYNDQIGDAS